MAKADSPDAFTRPRPHQEGFRASAYCKSARPPCIAVSCDSSASEKGPGNHRQLPCRWAAQPLTCTCRACKRSTLVFTVANAAWQIAKQRCIHSGQRRVVVSSWWCGVPVGASLRKRTSKVFCASCRCRQLLALHGGTAVAARLWIENPPQLGCIPKCPLL